MMKKLVVTVIQNEVADAVVDALLEAEYRATRLASTGGFLRRGNTTLLIGADEDQVDQVLDLIRQHARSRRQVRHEGRVLPYSLFVPAIVSAFSFITSITNRMTACAG